MKQYASDYLKYRGSNEKKYAEGTGFGKYLQEYGTGDHLPQNATEKQHRDYYMKKYAGPYEKYIKEDEAKERKADKAKEKTEITAEDLQEYGNGDHLPQNASEKQQQDFYMKKYAGPYEKYIKEDEAKERKANKA